MSFVKIAFMLGLASFASATTYAQFCDDNACSVNCGISVSTDNPGCLQESGRHSILFHGDNAQEVRLVYSPDANCSCQNECETVVGTGDDGISGGQGCKNLDGHAEALSFRFVGGRTCDPNNC